MIRARHSTFYLCQLSVTDARFPKYPRLPVVRCIGYSRDTPSASEGPGRATDDVQS
jgi:hypothetical protein